ncbi:MAG: mechanosensitive ion channel family protein [Streptosporangiaceae bacterium]
MSFPTLAVPFQDSGTPEMFCAPPKAANPQPSNACRLVWNISHDQDVTRFFHAWLDKPVTTLWWILATLVVAMLVRRYSHKLISKITLRMAEQTMSHKIREATRTIFDGSPALVSERRKQRAETTGSVLKSIASIFIMGTAFFTILGYLGLNLTPILASATVVGAAVGFGAQNTVKDFMAGLFMLLEDQYGVGDVVDTGLAKGTVESVSLRITRLRDVNGLVWYVRNGEITRIGNETQNWGRAVLDIPVAPDQNVDTVRDLLNVTAGALAADEVWEALILEQPSVWGVQAITNDATVVRITLKTAPGKQAEVARELRERVKKAFDEAGVILAPLT